MIEVENCLTGRLRNTYPAGSHDVEVRLSGVPLGDLPSTLRDRADEILESDPRCRKVVYAPPAGDLGAIAAAEAAGFRFVVNVDVPDGPAIVELALLVREPDFVTRVDMDLDRVPEN